MFAWSDRHHIREHQCSLEASPSTPSGSLGRTCAKREIGIGLSLRAGGEHRPDLFGRGRVRRRAPRSYANIVHRRGSLCGVDAHVRLGAAVPGSVLFKSTDHGATWSGPFTMNGAIRYNDKPILVISPSGQDVYVAFNVKLTSYVAVSHDAGQTFAQVQTSNESLWWYTYGGTYATDGSVYFAQAGEAGAKTNGKETNQGHTDGVQKIFVLRMNHQGTE